mmetsp:Transcript_29412/g.57560  ORF Transcript_29412/g.57560 Transcript_29412/m.57560 type:complete len:197 (+) Transcript_29412:163-753(+)
MGKKSRISWEMRANAWRARPRDGASVGGFPTREAAFKFLAAMEPDLPHPSLETCVANLAAEQNTGPSTAVVADQAAEQNTTPSKKRKSRQEASQARYSLNGLSPGMGGATSQAEQCSLCGRRRNVDQRGSACEHCLAIGRMVGLRRLEQMKPWAGFIARHSQSRRGNWMAGKRTRNLAFTRQVRAEARAANIHFLP